MPTVTYRSTFPAFAKLNLTLEVLGRRNDGYHEVRTILQTIDLADHLEIQPHADLAVTCSEPELAGEANLVWKAAMALAKRGGIRPRASIYIHKHIPAAMGLGGGSSDAAASLLGLNQLWGLSLPHRVLHGVAAELGSDVPFFLWGGTALGEGRGEKITPIAPLPTQGALLICPEATIPNKTAQIYSSLRPGHYTDGSITRRMVDALEDSHFSPDKLYNVFQHLARNVFPGLAELQQRVESLVKRPAHLSGSGSALFIIPATEQEHRQVAGALPNGGSKVYFVHTS